MKIKNEYFTIHEGFACISQAQRTSMTNNWIFKLSASQIEYFVRNSPKLFPIYYSSPHLLTVFPFAFTSNWQMCNQIVCVKFITFSMSNIRYAARTKLFVNFMLFAVVVIRNAGCCVNSILAI